MQFPVRARSNLLILSHADTFSPQVSLIRCDRIFEEFGFRLWSVSLL